MAKKKRTTLPRLTVLAYSSAELQRFSDAVEKIVAVQRDLRTLFDSLDQTASTLECATDVVVRRHNAAVKANATRKRKGLPAVASPDILNDEAPPSTVPSASLVVNGEVVASVGPQQLGADADQADAQDPARSTTGES